MIQLSHNRLGRKYLASIYKAILIQKPDEINNLFSILKSFVTPPENKSNNPAYYVEGCNVKAIFRIFRSLLECIDEKYQEKVT
jgi:hypothetical protein